MENRQEKSDSNFQTSLEFAKKIANINGYELNPNETQLSRLCKHMAENKENYGRFFCPYKQHYPVKTEIDPVCPCTTFRDEIKQKGHCECNLLFSPAAAAKRKKRPGLLANVSSPGLASKIPNVQLALALKQISEVSDPRVLVGHNNADDAGVIKINDCLIFSLLALLFGGLCGFLPRLSILLAGIILKEPITVKQGIGFIFAVIALVLFSF